MRTLIPSLVLVLTVASLATRAHAQQTTIVGGKVLIKLAAVAKTDDDARKTLAALAESERLDLSFERRSVLGWIIADVNTLGDEETRGVVSLLEKDKRVKYAQVVGVQHALATPNGTRQRV